MIYKHQNRLEPEPNQNHQVGLVKVPKYFKNHGFELVPNVHETKRTIFLLQNLEVLPNIVFPAIRRRIALPKPI